jgi:dihydroorotase
MSFELLKQVRVLDPVRGTDQVLDVLIGQNQIEALHPSLTDLPEGTVIHPCHDWVLGPGLIDLYSHSGEPGHEERETLKSLVRAAATGGFTRITLLPDTMPCLDQPATLAQLQSQSQSLAASVAVNFWGALTQGIKGQAMTEVGELAQAGIVGFADGQPLQDWTLVRRLLEYLQPLGKPIAFFAQDRSLTGYGVAREGSIALQLGLPESPIMAETVALAGLLEAVEATGTPVHVMRVSTARGVALIQGAKQRGLPVTASTTWLHLLCNTTDLSSYNPNLHLDPPLGNPADQQALIQGIEMGIIDAIAIDHAAYTYEEKTVPFSEAPPGAIGLELALPLLWQTFVASGYWSALTLWEKLSVAPAHCLGQQVEAILPGQPLELTLFDPQQTWIVDGVNLRSRSCNTAWLGKKLVGKTVKIYSSPKAVVKVL